MYSGKINYVVDADIKGFFDHMNYDWIRKYLKAGVITDGVFQESVDGSAQGNIMSPIIANIYMHNVLMLWYRIVFSKEIKGDSFLVVYADDFIA